MPREPSSPDPLQDLDGPSIYGGTPAPRAIKRTSSTVISPHKGKKLSHTTVVSTPTRSPWRIRVVVEAERDSGGEEGEGPVKRSRTTRTKTTKVPLRGLSPSPLVGGEEVVARAKRRATPVRRRRRSTTATPGGPGKTPARSGRGKSATPVLEEEGRVDIDEGIGSMMDGNGVLEEEENGDGDDVAVVAVQVGEWFHLFIAGLALCASFSVFCGDSAISRCFKAAQSPLALDLRFRSLRAFHVEASSSELHIFPTTLEFLCFTKPTDAPYRRTQKPNQLPAKLPAKLPPKPPASQLAKSPQLSPLPQKLHSHL